MKKICIFFFLLNIKAFSQCPVKAYAYPSSIFCGDSITLSALPSISKPIGANFNKGIIDSLLFATSNAVVVDSSNAKFSCFGLPPEGSHFLFMSTSTDTPRYVQTLPLNLAEEGAIGGTLCFYMRYGLQKGDGDSYDPCEGLDWSTEGVYLEYLINGGEWVEMHYWNPNPEGGFFTGGHDSILTNWNKYCLDLPKECLTSSTRFRLIQKDCNGAGYDAWAIDDFSVVLDIEGYTYDWTHDTLPPSITYETPLVAPISDTTYTVFYTNGHVSCSSDVKVSVLPPRDIHNASAECLCSHLFIPNAFTPNNDGINDIFMPVTFNVIEYELDIYNRYGVSVFHTKKYTDGWTGKIDDGNPLSQDVYTYSIMIRNYDRKLHFYIGRIVLIK